MQDWIQVLIALISGGAITAAISKINMLRPDKRKGEAEAEKQELENDDIRFNGLVATVDDLNSRLIEALGRMRELEDALNKSNAQVVELKGELLQAHSIIKGQQIEIDDLNAEVVKLRKENDTLKTKLEEYHG